MYKIKATYLPREDMTFDLDYYFRVHVPMAASKIDPGIAVLKVEVESKAESLLEPGAKATPCVFAVYLPDRKDVDRFRALLQSDAVNPLREDVPKYTNCELEWTVSEVTEV